MGSNRLESYLARPMTRTVQSSKTEMIESCYGTITYYDWCVREVMRINADGGSASIWEYGKMCAVK
jgi:hypothetical protein